MAKVINFLHGYFLCDLSVPIFIFIFNFTDNGIFMYLHENSRYKDRKKCRLWHVKRV